MQSCNVHFHETIDLTDSVDSKLIVLPKNMLRNPSEGIDDLVTSIREKGLIHPILIRPIGDKFEIVAGARRFEACKKLRWSKVPCIIRDVSDKNAYEISLVENVQRRTMNSIEEARAFKTYVDSRGWGSESQLARKIGKSQEYISQRLSLLTLPNSIQEKIIRHQITTSVALEIARLTDSERRKALSEEAVNQRMTVRMVREAANSLLGGGSIQYALLKADLKRHDKIGSDSNETKWDEIFEDSDSNDISESRFAKETNNFEHSSSNAQMLRSVGKSILILKLALSRLDSLIHNVSDESEARDMLLEKRLMIHNMIESLIKSKIKLGGRPQPFPTSA